jgi:peptide/nickel transport system permease protein
MLRKIIVRRLLSGLPLIYAILTINFLLMHLAPGDPITYMVSGIGQTRPEVIEMLREYYGLNDPVHVQYIRYLRRIVTGDFGYSYYYNAPVLGIITSKIGMTLIIMVPSIIIALLLGTYLGVIAAEKPHSRKDITMQFLSLVGWSIPEFWFSILFIIVFAIWLGVLPASVAPSAGLEGFDKIIALLRRAIGPVFVLIVARLAMYSRLTRSSMLEELNKDYILTARSKGCSNRTVLYKHALRNALIPSVTLFGLTIPKIFAGATSVELVFSWPGIGLLTVQAIVSRDFNMILAIFLFISILVIIGTLLTDIAYAYLDPRITYQRKSD